MPAPSAAYATKPLQSNPPGAAPPQRYGWPSMDMARSTITVRGPPGAVRGLAGDACGLTGEVRGMSLSRGG
jgi:hypothetical protein